MDRDGTLKIDWNEWREYLLLSPTGSIQDILHYWRHSSVRPLLCHCLSLRSHLSSHLGLRFPNSRMPWPLHAQCACGHGPAPSPGVSLALHTDWEWDHGTHPMWPLTVGSSCLSAGDCWLYAIPSPVHCVCVFVGCPGPQTFLSLMAISPVVQMSSSIVYCIMSASSRDESSLSEHIGGQS